MTGCQFKKGIRVTKASNGFEIFSILIDEEECYQTCMLPNKKF